MGEQRQQQRRFRGGKTLRQILAALSLVSLGRWLGASRSHVPLRGITKSQVVAASVHLRATIQAASNASRSSDPDANCPFRDSPIYRSVYVYPTFNGTHGGEWSGPILSAAGRDRGRNGTNAFKPWPWVASDQAERRRGVGKYDIRNLIMQSYSLELVVRDIMIHPSSCLRIDDPENATLFYIPYLPSAEYHREGLLAPRNCDDAFGTSPYAQAIIDAMDGKYDTWEERFGLTSKYWRRRSGSDHILVHSEVIHGLNHHIRERGNYHYVHSQHQLRSPISIMLEVSRTFVELHPRCMSKNVLVPYPNPDGRWYNGAFDDAAAEWRAAQNLTDVARSEAALPAEREIFATTSGGSGEGNGGGGGDAKPVAHFYRAGNHGICPRLRQTLQSDLGCTASAKVWRRAAEAERARATSKASASEGEGGHAIIGDEGWDDYTRQIRQATFCPSPVGDTPSAKRMFDTIIAGCIPVILSDEFVWPFTKEADPATADGGGSGAHNGHLLDPDEFAIRWNVSDYLAPTYDSECNKLSRSGTTEEGAAVAGDVQASLERIGPESVRKLRRGLSSAAELYSFYSRSGAQGVDNLLKERVLPDGGAAHALVAALADRARGVRWDACKAELKMPPRGSDPSGFECTLTNQDTVKPLQSSKSQYYTDLCKNRQPHRGKFKIVLPAKQ